MILRLIAVVAHAPTEKGNWIEWEDWVGGHYGTMFGPGRGKSVSLLVSTQEGDGNVDARIPFQTDRRPNNARVGCILLALCVVR